MTTTLDYIAPGKCCIYGDLQSAEESSLGLLYLQQISMTTAPSGLQYKDNVIATGDSQPVGF